MGTHEEVMAKTEMGFVLQLPGGIWFEADQRMPTGQGAAAATSANDGQDLLAYMLTRPAACLSLTLNNMPYLVVLV
jgi:hypothetical protein